jgi:PAS domain S-box-containing protein
VHKYSILDSLFDGILVIERDYKIIFANKTFLDICGLKAEDVIGQNCHKISHRCPVPCSLEKDVKRSLLNDEPQFICPHEEVFSKGMPVAVTHIHYCINDEERTFSITASPVIDEKGEVKEMVEILRDITDKEKAIGEERRCRAFLEGVLDGIGEGVVVIDRDYKIISANESYLRQTKNSLENIIGRHCYEVSHHYDKPCYEKGEECCVKHTFETGEHCRIIHTHYDKEGNPIYVEINSYPIRDSKGNITSTIETLTDVSQRIRLENDLKKRIKELEEFYDMAVGRELRMVDLKQEIERLKEELKRYKPSGTSSG